jgi:3,4-dihydroxy 2-butanone 4-phosphate synthase/GTP cyclohydrolase II
LPSLLLLLKLMSEFRFSTIQEAIEDIQAGKLVIVVDDGEPESEGSLVCAAEKVTSEIINAMATYARGLICMPTTRERLHELELPLMVPEGTSPEKVPFTVSIDAKRGIKTGISAGDRATTILVAIHPATKPEDLARPGHVFPVLARKGGVLRRAGHPEAAVDLARLAGLYPAGVICGIMNDTGAVATVPELITFRASSDFWNMIRIITITDLIKFRMKQERFVTRVTTIQLPTEFGTFKAICYQNELDNQSHIALVYGDISSRAHVLVRVHSQCLTGDVFGSQRCDCGEQLHTAIQMIVKEGAGVLLYMQQEGRGIGLANKLKAYALQDQGRDTVEANEELGFKADLRDYGIGAQILVDLGVRNIRLITNNPRKIIGLEGYNLKVVERVSIEIQPSASNIKYLATKQKKLGHLLNV